MQWLLSVWGMYWVKVSKWAVGYRGSPQPFILSFEFLGASRAIEKEVKLSSFPDS